MNLDEIMQRKGFSASLSGGGCEWYTREVKFKGQDAFIAITDNGGLGLPESLDEQVYVGIYDMNDGDPIVEAELVQSLRLYLDTFEEKFK